MLSTVVLSTITDCLCAQRSAEETLKSQAQDPAFALALTDITLDTTVADPARQLAALSLKQYVDSHWSCRNDRFTGPEPSDAVHHSTKTPR